MRIITIIFIFGFLTGLVFYRFIFSSFQRLSVEEMQSEISDRLALAIEKAEREGGYNCCVEPPCTMCFLEPNGWNNQKAGKCDCASFIGQGKEPCPQCKRILGQTVD